MTSKTKATTAVATVSPIGSMVVPDFLKDKLGEGRGTEHVTTTDITIPRIDVLQQLSPAIDEDSDQYIDGAKAGVLFNTLTRELYGQQVVIVPIMYIKEHLLWKDRKAGGGFRGAFSSENEARQVMTELEDGDQCGIVETSQFYCLVVSVGNDEQLRIEEAMVSMAKSKMKVARKLNSLIRLNGGDSFTRMYVLSSSKDKNSANETFYNFDVRNEGFVNEVIYNRALKMYEDVVAGRVKVDRTDAEVEANPESAGTASKF